MESDDRELLDRIKGGDGESFGELYNRTHRWLLSFVIVPRVGRADAEDVLSETFQVALREIHSFEWRGVGLVHWLATIARRKSQEHVRRISRHPEAMDDLPCLVDLPDDAPTAEAEMIRTQTLQRQRDKVERVLARMQPRYAAALRLRLLESRDREACAARLEVSTATFDVVFFRATKAFAREWGHHE